MKWLKRLLGRGEPEVQPLTYAQAKQQLAATGERQAIVILNPLIMHFGGAEQQKGGPLTEQELYAIRDDAMCVLMAPDQAKTFYEHMDAKVPVYRIDPENCWAEWQEIREEVMAQMDK